MTDVVMPGMGDLQLAERLAAVLVLGYGDPLEKKWLALFPNVNRKMQAMEAGGTVPMFVANGVDISEEIAALLNKQLREKSKTKPPKEDFEDFE